MTGENWGLLIVHTHAACPILSDVKSTKVEIKNIENTEPIKIVQADIRAHGFSNLRVVDASMLPFLPTGNLNAIIILIAERISGSIRGLSPLKVEFPTIGA